MAGASGTVSYIVDDRDTSISYLCPVFEVNVTNSYYMNTWTTIGNESCAAQWFKYTFSGTGVRISSPVVRDGQNYTAQIDDNEPERPYGHGIYQSPVLADTEHSVIFAMGDLTLQPAFDYLTVEAGESTSLTGKDIIVDDSQDTDFLNFSGHWQLTSPDVLDFDYSTGPFLNTLHWSNTVGDTMDMQFFGSSISVYGLVAGSESASGNITTTYTVDGVDTTVPLPTNAGSSDTSSVNITTPVVNLFHADLTPGNHTLQARISSVVSPSYYLAIDFIVYQSSVNNITNIRNASLALPVTTKSKPIGAIVGGVLGGLVFMGLFSLIVFLLKRKQRTRKIRRYKNSGINASFSSTADMVKKRPESVYSAKSTSESFRLPELIKQ